jgi:hypothetical protein
MVSCTRIDISNSLLLMGRWLPHGPLWCGWGARQALRVWTSALQVAKKRKCLPLKSSFPENWGCVVPLLFLPPPPNHPASQVFHGMFRASPGLWRAGSGLCRAVGEVQKEGASAAFQTPHHPAVYNSLLRLSSLRLCLCEETHSRVLKVAFLSWFSGSRFWGALGSHAADGPPEPELRQRAWGGRSGVRSGFTEDDQQLQGQVPAYPDPGSCQVMSLTWPAWCGEGFLVPHSGHPGLWVDCAHGGIGSEQHWEDLRVGPACAVSPCSLSWVSFPDRSENGLQK